MEGPIQDPYASVAVHAPRPRAQAGRAARIALLVVALFASVGFGALVVAPRLGGPAPAPSSVVVARPSPALLIAIRDLSRLETTEVHVEKVVDLADRQNRLFGLVQATDALLLVAVGHVTIGVDLARIGEGDIAMEPETGVARLTLPAPEVFSTRLDEDETYVYTRSTSLLARRNEQLEGRARKEATAAIEKAALEGNVMARAKAQAERQITALATQLGAKRVEIRWREVGGGGG
ncbi:putative secreted protein [Sorangium cellulosum So ce56]|uniref:Secreted protein n=1 Tax=Sorangium cellulosum (strain So ce56) TaxID=448385 RepID=A9GGF7_SORC5|nr:DUF4230 domain-containing protein [Sorangium cellulosum]CAN96321.1 putative secreted protein [Sorangium cellulosum So ce56]